VLQDWLRELWPDPRRLDDIGEFLEWDDFRVVDSIRGAASDAARALRDRRTLYGLASEFNAESDLLTFDACQHALRERYGDAVWSDSQEQLLHRLPLGADNDDPTVYVGLTGRIVDAREASDLIRRLSGKAYWRKLFVDKRTARTEDARAICREIIGRAL